MGVRTGSIGAGEQWTTKDVDFLNEWLAKIHAWVTDHGGGPMIPFSGAFEQALLDCGNDDEYKAKCDEMGTQSVLPKIIKTAFASVHLMYFFTCGPDEVRGWCIRKGCKAPQATGAIHSDFERGFICAEVMAFEDLKALGSEAECKAKGKSRQEGKTYTVVDGDVIFFKFNVTNAKK